MTSTPPDDWSDDRLSAAFAARAASTPPTPTGLPAEVRRRIERSQGRVPVRWPRLAPVGAVAILVIVLAGPGIVGRLEATPGASQEAPATSPQQPAATVTTPPGDLALAALGEPITVTAALEIRQSEDSGRELVVKGFISPAPVIYCALEFTPFNPTKVRCPESKQWVMEEQEQLWGPGVTGTHEPKGPAFHPSFALIEPPEIKMPATADELPVPVVVIGHFNDRRARLCPERSKTTCAETFVVDRVESVNGRDPGTTSWQDSAADPRDSEQLVNELVATAAPGSILLSRRLLSVAGAIQVEPLLSNDQLIPFADPGKLAWISTMLDTSTGRPVVRTFMLLDGSSWFAEITAAVVRQLPWSVPGATDGPVQPSAQPDAFASAPTSVLGIPVRDIATLERDRQSSMDEGGRDEVALRAWYVAPNPSVVCDDAPPPLHEPRPPCDEARHWLLDDPAQFGIMRGQLRQDPSIDHYPPVLNPLLPVDVTFDAGDTWVGGTPTPRPVIVLGHFEDHRVDTYAGNLYFVIDALAWTADRPVVSFDTVVRLTPNATEDVDSVLARVAAVDPRPAAATWVTVVEAGDFAALDRRFESMPEFSSGPPVWMVARLVSSETDGRQRLAVVWAWTADGGSRVWWTECPDCSPDLATTLDVRDLDANTPLVRVFDYDRAITSVGSASGLTGLAWQQPHGNATDWLDVAQGRSSRELVLRWRSPAECSGPWDITVQRVDDERFGGDDIYLSPTMTDAECTGERVTRRVVMEFKDPIDIDRISGPSCCG